MSQGTLPNLLLNRRTAHPLGVAMALVTDNKDAEGLGRVKVKFPWLDESDESHWARIVTPMAGKDCGLYLLPEVGDEVLIAFEQGSVDHPYVLGSLWNGVDKPPDANADGKNNHRFLKSRSGHMVRLDDTEGAEKIQIIDKSGKNNITIATADNSITIHAAGNVKVEAQGKLTLTGAGVEITSTAAVAIKASQDINVTASGQASIKGSLINLN
ncbi:phage baseplate assembly protein V [Terriglobus albidus]|nr:phage baseplate assembly protein V [Terriglobus albidus]